MNNVSPLRSRRLSARQVEPTRQLVVFRIRQELFALLIDVVQKVIPMGNAYGDVRGTGIGLTVYQDRELVVVDIARRLFGEALSSELLSKHALPPTTNQAEVAQASPLPATGSTSSVQEQQATKIDRCMLIVQTSKGELVGLPIDSPPALRRVPDSAFAPLPPAYLSHVPIQCVTSVIVKSQDEQPIFLIDPEQLLKPWNTDDI